MKVKYVKFEVFDKLLIENRINEEILGWQIQKFVYFGMVENGGIYTIDFVGEVKDE